MMGRHLMLALALLAAPTLPSAESTTLTGQVVCSVCWFEADRDKVPYGNAGDLDCWKTCAKQGVSTALAVTEAGKTRLVTLEYGRLKKTSDGWYPYVGKRVEVRGNARAAEPPTIAVDEIRVLEAERRAP